MLLAAAFQVKDATEVGIKAGLTVLESSLLGALAILCLLIGVVGVWLSYRTQNARVADQKKMSGKLEELIREQTQFTTSMTLAIKELDATEKQQVAVLQRILLEQQALKTTMDSIVAGLMSGRK